MEDDSCQMSRDDACDVSHVTFHMWRVTCDVWKTTHVKQHVKQHLYEKRYMRDVSSMSCDHASDDTTHSWTMHAANCWISRQPLVMHSLPSKCYTPEPHRIKDTQIPWNLAVQIQIQIRSNLDLNRGSSIFWLGRFLGCDMTVIWEEPVIVCQHMCVTHMCVCVRGTRHTLSVY